ILTGADGSSALPPSCIAVSLGPAHRCLDLRALMDKNAALEMRSHGAGLSHSSEFWQLPGSGERIPAEFGSARCGVPGWRRCIARCRPASFSWRITRALDD